MRGYWDATRTFGQLIPGFRDSDVDGVLAKIGTFDFVFYYLKRSATKMMKLVSFIDNVLTICVKVGLINLEE